MSGCCCKVGPGRYEGESAETVMLAEMAADGCAEMHGPDGASYDYFAPVAGAVFGPGDFTDDVVTAAREAGFCWPCIAAGILRLLKCKGAVVGQTEQGFIWSRIADTDDEHVQMLADIAADDAEAEAEAEADEA